MLSDDVAANFIVLGKLTAVGSDVTLGSKSVIPQGAGPYTQIVDTGGPSPRTTHDDYQLRQPQVQVNVRASLASVARAKAEELRDAVGAGWYNITINGTLYLKVAVQGEVMDLQEDKKGRPKFGFNLISITG